MGRLSREHRPIRSQRVRISPREAQSWIRQQRLMLVVAKESLEDAGQLETDMRGSATGVFVGVSTWDYSLLQYASQTEHRVIPTRRPGWPSPSSPIASRTALIGMGQFERRHRLLLIAVAVHLACESI